MAADPLLACLEQLDAAGNDAAALLRALKALKTALVGNRARKLACCEDMSRLRRLVKLLELTQVDAATLSIKLQAATIIGILAMPAEEPLLNLLACDAPLALWSAFRNLAPAGNNASSAPREARDLLVAVLRALRSLNSAVVAITGPRKWGAITLPNTAPAKSEGIKAGKTRMRVDRLPSVARSTLAEAFKHDNVTCLLVILTTSTSAFLSAQKGHDSDISGSTWTPAAASAWHLTIAELCCSLVANTVRTRDQQIQLLSDETAATAALSALVSLVQSSHARVEEAALNALSAIVHDFGEAALAVQMRLYLPKSDDLPIMIIASRLESRSPALQIAAAQCLTHLYRANKTADTTSLSSYRPLLSVLLRLLSDHDGFETQAASTLAYLVAGHEPLQCAACELGAMRILSNTIKWDSDRMMALQGDTTVVQEQDSELLQECCLLAIAQLTLLRDDLRRKVAEERLLPRIVAYLRSSSVTLRGAAAECVRALSRSANMLRSGLVEAGAATPLFELLSDDEDDSVREVAVAAISNLVLDFSPMKQSFIDKEIFPRLVAITKTTSGPLRVKALAALKNAVYWSDSPLKRLVVQHLGFDYLVILIQDSDPAVQIEALNILRNLACNAETDIAMTVSGIGESRLFTLIEEKLRSSNDVVVTQAIYVLVNIATGDEFQRRPIMMRPAITRALLAHLSHPKDEVRVGAVWCIHNLARGVHENIVRLRGLGFEARLRDLADDLSLDVRERVADALGLFGLA